jgi:hypothetical protein
VELVGRELVQSKNGFLTQLALRVKDLDVHAAYRGPSTHQKIGARLCKWREVDYLVAGFPDVRHGGAVEDERLDPIAVIEIALDDGSRRITVGGVDRQDHDSLRYICWPLGRCSSWANWASLSVRCWSEREKGRGSKQEFAIGHLRFNVRDTAMVHRNSKAAE